MVNSKWLGLSVFSFRQANQNIQIHVHQGTESKNGVRFIGQSWANFDIKERIKLSFFHNK